MINKYERECVWMCVLSAYVPALIWKYFQNDIIDDEHWKLLWCKHLLWYVMEINTFKARLHDGEITAMLCN